MHHSIRRAVPDKERHDLFKWSILDAKFEFGALRLLRRPGSGCDARDRDAHIQPFWPCLLDDGQLQDLRLLQVYFFLRYRHYGQSFLAFDRLRLVGERVDVFQHADHPLGSRLFTLFEVL